MCILAEKKMGQAASSEAFVGQLADRLDNSEDADTAGMRPPEHLNLDNNLDKLLEERALRNSVDTAQEYADGVEIQLLQSRMGFARTGGDAERERELSEQIMQANARRVFRETHDKLGVRRRQVGDLQKEIMQLVAAEVELQKHMLRLSTAAAYISRQTLEEGIKATENGRRVDAFNAQERDMERQASELIRKVGDRETAVAGMSHDLSEWMARVQGYEDSKENVATETDRKLLELRARAEVIASQMAELKTKFSGLDAAYTARAQEVQATLPPDAPPVGAESDEALASISTKMIIVRNELEYLQREMKAVQIGRDLVEAEELAVGEEAQQSVTAAHVKMQALAREMQTLESERANVQRLAPVIQDMRRQLDMLQAVSAIEKRALEQSRDEFKAFNFSTARSGVILEHIRNRLGLATRLQQKINDEVHALIGTEQATLTDLYSSQPVQYARALSALAQTKEQHDATFAAYQRSVRTERERMRLDLQQFEANLSRVADLPPGDLAARYKEGGKDIEEDLREIGYLTESAEAQLDESRAELKRARELAESAEADSKKRRADNERLQDEAAMHGARMLAGAKNLGRVPDMRPDSRAQPDSS